MPGSIIHFTLTRKMATLQVLPGVVGEGRGGYMAEYLCWELKFLLSLLFSCSVVSNSLWPRRFAAHRGSLSFTISWSLLKLMSIESVMPSNHLILCHPLLLPSVFPSIRMFSNKSALHIRWPKYWSFSFSISPSSEYSGLISFRIDWFNLLSLLQHHMFMAFRKRKDQGAGIWCTSYCFSFWFWDVLCLLAILGFLRRVNYAVKF